MKITKLCVMILVCTLTTYPLIADTVVRSKDGKMETLEGTIVSESFERVEIRTSDGKLSIKTEEIYSASRDGLSGLLSKAQGQAVAAATDSAAAAADAALQKAAKNAKKPWEREYAAWFRFRLWADRGNLDKATAAAGAIASANAKSRFLPEAWIDISRMAYGAGDSTKIKNAGAKLKPLGTLGRAASGYFQALALLAKKDLKSGGDKMRLAFRQLQAQKSVAGRKLWLSAAWRYGQVLVQQKNSSAAQEHLDILKKDFDSYDDRGKGLTHCLEGDVLRLKGKKPEALYAYMRVVVQYPNFSDAHAHALDWAAAISTELKYTEDAKKLLAELKSRHGSYKRQATN